MALRGFFGLILWSEVKVPLRDGVLKVLRNDHLRVSSQRTYQPSIGCYRSSDVTKHGRSPFSKTHRRSRTRAAWPEWRRPGIRPPAMPRWRAWSPPRGGRGPRPRATASWRAGPSGSLAARARSAVRRTRRSQSDLIQSVGDHFSQRLTPNKRPQSGKHTHQAAGRPGRSRTVDLLQPAQRFCWASPRSHWFGGSQRRRRSPSTRPARPAAGISFATWSGHHGTVASVSTEPRW